MFMEKLESENDCLDNIDDDDLWNMLDNFASSKTETKNEISDITSEINAVKICKLCSSKNIVFDSTKAVYICIECGCEIGEIFECKPEWTNYEDNNHDNSRCGVATNPFFPKSSTSTTIKGLGCYKMKMLQSWDQFPYKERSLAEVLNVIEHNLKKYKITKSIIDNAKILYKNLSEIKHTDGINKGKSIIIRGLNRRGLIAACAFYGAKLQNSPRSTKEISDIFGLDEKQVTKGCRRYLELRNYETMSKLFALNACDYITNYGYKLGLFKQQIEMALKITNNITKLDIASDHQPTSVAAGSIMLLSDIENLKLSKSNISNVFQISEVTIMKTYKKILPYKNYVLNDTIIEKMIEKMKIKIQKNKDIIINDKNVFLSSDTISDISNSSNNISLSNTSITTEQNKTVIESEKKKRGRPKKLAV